VFRAPLAAGFGVPFRRTYATQITGNPAKRPQ
jgi:hypothetical protein